MKTLNYTIHLEAAEEGGYVVSVPALPGCLTQGESYDDALAMARECIEGYLEALAKAGKSAPIESPLNRPLDAVIQIHSALAV